MFCKGKNIEKIKNIDSNFNEKLLEVLNMSKRKTNAKNPGENEYKTHEKVIYIGGLYKDYTDKECRIVSRRKEWYRIEFDDNKIILTPFYTIKRKEDVVDSN